MVDARTDRGDASCTGGWLRAQSLLALLLPLRCLGCGQGIAATPEDQAPVCTGCRLSLTSLPSPRCLRCDLPLGSGRGRRDSCAHCLIWPAELTAARSATALEGAAARLVHALKYEGWRVLARPMGLAMSRVSFGEGPAVWPPQVIPMPTLSTRRRRRGYNQAEVLARQVALARGGWLCRALRRVGGGPSQVSLQAEERAANVLSSFEPGPDADRLCRDVPVLLVDDVMTTGATASAAVRKLVSLGAGHVRVLTFARALPREILRVL